MLYTVYAIYCIYYILYMLYTVYAIYYIFGFRPITDRALLYRLYTPLHAHSHTYLYILYIQVRATSAKALGSLIGGVGETEDEVSGIIPWLFVTLSSDNSPVERSGSAQGLAEICQALGEEKLRRVLTDALPLRHHPNSAPREVSTYIYFTHTVIYSGTVILYHLNYNSTISLRNLMCMLF